MLKPTMSAVVEGSGSWTFCVDLKANASDIVKNDIQEIERQDSV